MDINQAVTSHWKTILECFILGIIKFIVLTILLICSYISSVRYMYCIDIILNSVYSAIILTHATDSYIFTAHGT